MTLTGVIAAADTIPRATRLAVDVAGGAAGEPERVIVLVHAETEVIVESADGTGRRGGVANLAAGARIRVRYTGGEMRSLPPQYNAGEIRVLPGS